jgi:predicted protein tyrosine phosphatase
VPEARTAGGTLASSPRTPLNLDDPCMSTLHICPLEDVSDVIARHAPSHAVSLIHLRNGNTLPQALQQAQALHLNIDDITEPQDGCVYPEAEHIDTLIDFLSTWKGDRPILIHCWQGISRSVASGLILLAMHAPGREMEQASRLQEAMPFARPNKRLLALADDRLQRGGRLLAMVEVFQPEVMVDIGQASSIRVLP